MRRLRLPSFRRSPRKGTESRGDPGHGLAVDAGGPGVHAPRMEAPVDVTAEQDGEKGRVKTPKPTLPKMQASQGGAGLRPGDPESALSSSTAGAASRATVGASREDAAGGTSTTSGPPEGAGGDLHLPRAHLPSVGFAKPDVRPGQVQGEVSQSTGHLPLPEHGLSVADGRREDGLGDGSASQAPGAPSPEGPPQASCGTPGPAAPTAGSPEADVAVDAARAGSQDSWFRMPSLRLPSFWRSSRERGGAGGPGAPQEGEAPAAVKSPGVCAPLSEAEADVAKVLSQSLDSKDLELHWPPARMSPDGPPTSAEAGLGPVPLQTPGGRISETQAPPGEPDKAPARGAGSPEPPSPPPEGPLKLKALRTDVPARVSVVDMGRLWEDSVITVKFPALKVPRFTFPASGCEADVFVPAVREVWIPDSSLDLALFKERPGAWGASVLKAGAGVPGQQPVVLDLPADAHPISKVRVHIQGARVESQEVTVHSRVTTEFADLSGSEAFSTQIVRKSEIPASEIQVPSYGFSLLKGKVPESPLRAQVHVVTQDSQLPPKGFQAAPEEVALGAEPSPGAAQPDPGEPFEVISSSVQVPGTQTFTFEVSSGPQAADSFSDEEPAEILEFPPEDAGDEGGAAKEKPESKRPSGRFRFWLPSIGFSSSAADAGADPAEGEQTPAPGRAQPEARPEAELPRKQEKAGWFRFPRLGFSSAPSKQGESAGDEAGPVEPRPQEEAVTFFDARESFSAEDKEDWEPAEAAGAGPGPSPTAVPAAGTDLARREQGGNAGAEPAPRPETK